MGVENKSKKPKKAKKGKKTISFEEEIVTRDEARNLLKLSERLVDSTQNSGGDDDHETFNTTIHQLQIHDDPKENAIGKSAKRNKKRGQRKPQEIDTLNSEDVHQTSAVDESEPQKKVKKRKKKDKSVDSEMNEALSTEDTVEEEHEPVTTKKRKKRDAEPVSVDPESEPTNTEEVGAKKESIRQRKKKKHIKLLEEKKMKVEVQLQQKALEYLSRWKHSKNSWKFEKLRQIWLQQNLFESTKVPSEFWDTTLEYFTSARGKVKTVLMQKALKIIEGSKPIEDDEDTGECEEESDNEELVKAKRARDIMQYLQDE